MLDRTGKFCYSFKENEITFVGFEPAVASSERINRETGVSPVRSRHCIWELSENQYDTTGHGSGKASESVEHKSGDLLAVERSDSYGR